MNSSDLNHALAWLLGGVLPVILLGSITWLLYTVPMRRVERARLFVDLLETGLRDGRSPEHTIMALAACHDTAPGVRFHLLAAHLELGCRLGEALRRVPRLLPPQLTALFGVGAEVGGIARVLPMARTMLMDALGRPIGVMNAMRVPHLFLPPIQMALLVWVWTQVMPRLKQFAGEVEMESPWPLLQSGQGLAWTIGLLAATAGIFCAVWLGLLGGPRLADWGRFVFGSRLDEIALWLPWRRKRVLRDFISLLAVALDAGTPEEPALRLAAASTANLDFIVRADRAIHALREGANLPQALAMLDESRELPWRLANAARGADGFTSALAGWCEALDAQAYQSQQAFTHLLAAGFVVLNGLIVGLTAMTLFGFLIHLTNEAVLW